MDEFTAYFDSSVISSKSSNGKIVVKPSGILKMQTFWNNNIYDSSIIESLKNNLKFVFHNESDIEKLSLNSSDCKFCSSNNDILDYNSMQDIIWCNDENGESIEYDYVVPVLEVDGNYIIYNQFNTVISREEQELDSDKITLGGELFKYYVDLNSITLNFDYISFPGCNLEYRLIRYVDPCQITDGSLTSGDSEMLDVYKNQYQEIETNYTGQNVIDIVFTSKDDYKNQKYNSSDTKYNQYTIKANKPISDFNLPTMVIAQGEEYDVANTFDKEDFYLIQFRVVLNGSDEIKVFDPIPLYVTELVNRFYYLENNYVKLNDYGEPVVNLNNLSDALEDNIAIKVEYNLNKYHTKVKIGNNEINPVLESDTDNEEISAQKHTVELLKQNEEFNKDQITKYFGPEIVNFDGSDRSVTKTINVSSGKEYQFLDDLETPSKVDFPKNQYGVTGRLWRGIDVVFDRNSHVLLDKKGNKYKLADGKLFIYDNYALNLTTYSSNYNTITKFKRLTDLSSYSSLIGKPFLGQNSFEPIKNEFISFRGGIELYRNVNSGTDGYQLA